MKVENIDVFVGIDVGKSEYWATALTWEGKKVFNTTLPNDEARLRGLYETLASHGQILVVVYPPATIGALAIALAQDMGVTVAYFPGLSMRRIADLTSGAAKTDAKDAAVIADAARTMPHTLRMITTSGEDAAALSMLIGFDLDLARQVNQTVGRIQDPRAPRPRPALEKVLGPWLEHDAILQLIATWPTPPCVRPDGHGLTPSPEAHGSKRHTAWAQSITDALAHQSVTVAGTDTVGVVLPHLARQIIALAHRRILTLHAISGTAPSTLPTPARATRHRLTNHIGAPRGS